MSIASRPLALDDQMLCAILDAAEPLPVDDRHDFLTAVVRELGDAVQTPAELRAAIARTQMHFRSRVVGRGRKQRRKLELHAGMPEGERVAAMLGSLK